MQVQIYAATSVADALTMAKLGVDQIGFVAGVYNEVHGELPFDKAREITQALTGKALSSALTMSADLTEILHMVGEVQPDIVHISSETEAVGVAALRQLRASLPPEVVLMKAVHVADNTSLATARRFAAVSDILLLDTEVEGMPGVGATGVPHDWRISRRIVEAVTGQAKVILAGGLTPANVAQAIATVRPWGVDSNTGTNLPGDPLVKDMDRVRAFVTQAKQPI